MIFRTSRLVGYVNPFPQRGTSSTLSGWDVSRFLVLKGLETPENDGNPATKSGQMEWYLINLDFPEIEDFPDEKSPFGEFRSCEVATIWPEQMISKPIPSWKFENMNSYLPLCHLDICPENQLGPFEIEEWMILFFARFFWISKPWFLGWMHVQVHSIGIHD